jgi:hypothetical protein
MAKSANVTKYDAGGTGDNLIPDGYIKAVEKVWIDTYTYSSAATIGIGLVVEVAKIPENKKVTSIQVFGLGTIANTTSTVQIGCKSADNATTNSTQFLAATVYGSAASTLPINANTGLGVALTGGVNTITLLFAAANQTVTGGTITTVVRYT